MFWLKNCPRCHGDLCDKNDNYGDYIGCFQCGHYLTADEEAYVRSGNPPGRTFTLPLSRPELVLSETAA